MKNIDREREGVFRQRERSSVFSHERWGHSKHSGEGSAQADVKGEGRGLARNTPYQPRNGEV